MQRIIAIVVDEDLEGEFPLVQSLKGAGCQIAGTTTEGKLVLAACTGSPDTARAILGFCWMHPSVTTINIQPVQG